VLVAVVSNVVSFPAVGAVAVVVEVVVVKGRSPSPMACSSIIKPAGLSLTGSSLIRTLPCPIATHVTGVQPCLLCFSKWCYLNKRQSLSTQRDAFSKVILRGQHSHSISITYLLGQQITPSIPFRRFSLSPPLIGGLTTTVPRSSKSIRDSLCPRSIPQFWVAFACPRNYFLSRFKL